ncbi:MAG: guanitoxin biosynthesis MBL fold metallo-hydrolase GntH [Planctomycetota bacterium]|jgi:ribonuclease Z
MNAKTTTAFIAGFVTCGVLVSLALSWGDGRAQAKPPSTKAAPPEWSRTKPYPVRDVYYPGTEELAPDEMRIIALGTGMPQPRPKQAAACFLVELGNGEKFIFDMGEGSLERIMALGIPLDQLDKVFLGHLHLDHAGDFPAFYFTGPVNNRLTPLRVWGPSGVKPEWGTKAWWAHTRKAWAWEEASRGSALDPRGLQIEVTEFDWTADNNLIYNENGVTVRTIPAIHADQSVSFLLEWNGLKFAFSSDTLPNKWWLRHAQDADIAIHEAFIPPDLMMEKFGFAPSEAIFVGTQGHTYAAAFGKIMSMTRPRLAVAYHFQNDFDTAPAVRDEIRKTYDGPLDLATDFMVWNVTADEIRTRMAAPNLSLSGVEPESAAVTNAMIKEFNKRHGTNIQPAVTGLPFRNR